MSGTNHGLTGKIAASNHHLLCQEHLRCGDFNAQVTTGHHNTIGLVHNFIEVKHTLVVLNLGDDAHAGRMLSEN